DVATQYFGYSISTYRLEELARDLERVLGAIAAREPRARDDIEKAISRLREYARTFFDELAFAHGDRSRAPSSPRPVPDQVPAPAESLAEAHEAASHLTSALDIVESTLQLMKKADRPEDPDAADFDDDVAALARRAGEIRDEIRFLMRAGDPDYVYFVEFRSRVLRRAQDAPSVSRGAVFLRASPIDVSRIVRELLLDRMQTTVLTSATLTVDGSFDYIRSRLGISRAT